MAATMLTMAAASAQLAMSPLSQVSFTRVRVQGARTSVGTRRIVCMAAPQGSSGPAINVGDKLAEKIEDAQQTCAGNDQSEECAAAWDEVESVSASVADEKAKNKGKGDPLEEFCEDNPEADECRVYTD